MEGKIKEKKNGDLIIRVHETLKSEFPNLS